MEYNYVLTTSYDGELFSTLRLSDFMQAHEAWAKCVDYGNAKEYATYSITDLTGRSYEKTFYAKN